MEADVLYISFEEESILLRCREDKLIGITILNASRLKCDLVMHAIYYSEAVVPELPGCSAFGESEEVLKEIKAYRERTTQGYMEIKGEVRVI